MGYVKVNERDFHNVAISLFGTVIGFRSTESGIASPVVREDLKLIELPEHTNLYNMAIGAVIMMLLSTCQAPRTQLYPSTKE